MTMLTSGDILAASTSSRATACRWLDRIDTWLDTEPALHAMADDRFLEALEAFEGSSNQREQIAAKLTSWSPSGDESPGDRPDALRWLSIGCGGGDLDAMVARAFADEHARQHYVGIDPNPVECARCRKLFAALPGSIEATVVAKPFEAFDGEADSFDLIYAAHTFYYVTDVERTVGDVERLLRPGGELIVLQAPLGALNQLANRFWEARLSRSVPYSDTIEQRLRALRPSVRRFRIEAELDVTACLGSGDHTDDHGRAVLDFILQLDTSRLPPEVQKDVRAYLGAISRPDGARWLAPHPVDGFVLTA